VADNTIIIEGARQNNLKGFNLRIPLNALTVVTGVSGSGKSSLAFDTVYAEGQRRYVETFSPYARQFLDRMDKPKVDRITGIPPAIAIDQTNPVRTSRSTVGTMTELNDHLKLLYARGARLVCSACGEVVRRDTPESIEAALAARLPGKTRLLVVFRVPIPANFTVDEVKAALERQGYVRFHREADDALEVIQDRLTLAAGSRSRRIEALEAALHHGRGRVTVVPLAADGAEGEPLRFSEDLHCAKCDLHYRDPVPNLFSFNSPLGACDQCRGFGRTIGIDYGLVIPDESLSLEGGAVKPFQTASYRECQSDLLRFARRRGVSVDKPWRELATSDRQWVVAGDGRWEDGCWYGIDGFFAWMESKSYKMHIRVLLSKYRAYTVCAGCGGARLKPEALLWRVGPGAGLNIHELMLLPLADVATFFAQLELPPSAAEAVKSLLQEIRSRLRYLNEVGLGYLTLDRQSRTLSGGEVQRINLTTALGTTLVNTLFVLDEPSVGLHPRDTNRLTAILHRLRDTGNTLLVVEHDPDVMRAADRVIDMGPGAGEQGGEIVFEGSPAELEKNETSLTGAYLRGEKSVQSGLAWLPPPRPDDPHLEILGATANNLRHIDVRLPLGRLVCVTGVSGSGKSTLIEDVLYRGLLKRMGQPAEAPGEHRDLRGHEHIGDVVMIDQRAIGKTTRSNPASYVGAWDPIRACFAAEPEAKARGYTTGTFSFNSGKRCPACGGNGFQHIEMQFLSDVYLRCPECDGTRFQAELLDIRLRLDDGPPRSIADVLEMTVDEACAYFAAQPAVTRALQPLRATGLGYLRLGQSVPTLSGGEAQRLKLAAHLKDESSSSKPTLFLLDEPTTGLHFADIAVLLQALRVLVVRGHSVVVIEHNTEVMRAADWIIDLGPEGGTEGGRIVCCGTPADIAASQQGHTAAALRQPAGSDRLYPVRSDASPSQFREGRVPPRPSPREGRIQPRPQRCESGPDAHETVPTAPRVESGSPDNTIRIINAREHNLKHADITIPRDAFTVITGLSGSGKSTVAFDILYNEGQRRYLESLNAYARQFVQPASRPEVDSVTGVPPTVAIEQRISRGGLKSTVATVTEIYHYLRLLFVKLGVQHCPECALPIEPQSLESILASVQRQFKGKRVAVLAPLITGRKGYYTDLAKWALGKGFEHLRVDGQLLETAAWPRLDRYREHDIDLPVGELAVSPANGNALRTLIEQALSHGDGAVRVAVASNYHDGRLPAEIPAKAGTTNAFPPSVLYSTVRACPGCGKSFPELDPRLFSFNSKQGWCERCFGTGVLIRGFDAEQTGEEAAWVGDEAAGEPVCCPACHGKRLRPEALAVQFQGGSINTYAAQTVEAALTTFFKMRWSVSQAAIAADLQAELCARLRFMGDVGLGYLTLDRAVPTLSGGEAQRIRLASQLGSNLRGVCYVLDEPTIGLHARDNEKLLATLRQLQQKGNTIVVVEHDEETIRQADHVIDLGPGAGIEGGYVTAAGTPAEVMADPQSVTGRYLKSPLKHPLGGKRRPCGAGVPALTVRKATLHNLKALTVDIPLQRLVCVTGVSGSGKSTLVRDVLLGSLRAGLATSTRGGKPRGGAKAAPVAGCEAIEGREAIERVLEVDQTPIGRTPRSCPATYVGFWDRIRALFAATPEARMRGYDAARFSFNTGDGRCPECKGNGYQTVEMSFLPNVSVLCDACGGRRFTEETCQVTYQGLSIADVLALSVNEAVTVFAAHRDINRSLRLLQDVGLGYLTLGQRSPTLSGGEAQRIKLVTELARSGRQQGVLYVLDEPTIGLHMGDVANLIAVLQRLVEAGGCVILIEHNLDLIAEADWVIDLGPEGGESGGRLIGAGTPEHIARLKRSHTGRYLAPLLKPPR